MVKVRSLESVPFSRYLCLCNVLRICYIGSGPSPLIESIDSMIKLELEVSISHVTLSSVVFITFDGQSVYYNRRLHSG